MENLIQCILRSYFVASQPQVGDAVMLQFLQEYIFWILFWGLTHMIWVSPEPCRNPYLLQSYWNTCFSCRVRTWHWVNKTGPTKIIWQPLRACQVG